MEISRNKKLKERQNGKHKYKYFHSKLVNAYTKTLSLLV